jgi:hypothetical protein
MGGATGPGPGQDLGCEVAGRALAGSSCLATSQLVLATGTPEWQPRCPLPAVSNARGPSRSCLPLLPEAARGVGTPTQGKVSGHPVFFQEGVHCGQSPVGQLEGRRLE